MLGLLLFPPGVILFTPIYICYVILTSVYNIIWPEWVHDENEERGIGATDGEVDPLESSYYMIDKLLTKLINIGIERNECQIRRVEVVKELEKAKKLHDYVASISQHNSATIQRQGGAYILRNILP